MQGSLRNAQAMRVPEPAEIWRWLDQTPRTVWRYVAARERLPLWALLGLAALLRLSSLDLIPFGLAQAHSLERASQVGRGALIATPFESALALPLWLDGDPRLAAAWLVLLNLIALFAIHRAIARTQGPQAAHLSALFLVVTPWSVLLSRHLDPAALVMPLSAMLLAGLYAALRARWAWGWTIAWLSVGLLLAVSHWTAPLLLVTATLTLCFPARVRWAHALLGALLAALLLLPYWYHAPEQTPWQSVMRFFVEEPSQPPALAGGVLAVARDLHSGQGLGALLAPTGAAFGPGRPLAGGMAVLAGWLWLLALPTMLWLAARAWSRWQEAEDAAGYLIPAAWVGLSLLALWARGGPVTPMQVAFLLPGGAVAMGLTLDRIAALSRSLRRGGGAIWSKGAVYLFVAGYLAWSTVGIAALYRHVVDHDVSHGYGTPVRFWERTARAVIRNQAAYGLDDVWVIADGYDPARHEEPAALTYLLGDHAELRFVPGSNPKAILLPADRDALYLLLQADPQQASQLDLWGGQQVARVLFPGATRQAELRWVGARPASELLAAIPHRTWAPFDAGVQLVGYAAPSLVNGGSALVMTTYWILGDAPPEGAATQHRITWLLYGRDGALLARAVPFGLSETAWRRGLLLKQWHTLALPEGLPTGPYEAHLLIERWPDGYRHQVLDDLRRPVADRYVIGPFVFE